MSNDEIREDDEYLSLLREASGTVPLGHVNWDALYARVDAAAELPLARRRRGSAVPVRRVGQGAWWEYAARRGRAAIPLAVAASLAFVAYARAHPIDESTTTVASAADVRDAFEATVTDGGTSGQVASLLVASPTDADSVASDVTP
jgi:hypothetical protein